MVKIVEVYKDWRPPKGVRRSIERLMARVPSRYCAGLGVIVLTNASGLTGRRKRKKVKSDRGTFSLSKEVQGLYQERRGTEQASIELFVDRMLEGPPGWILRVGIVREIVLAGTLYHELGHHIERTRAPRRNKEAVAEQWAKYLEREYLLKQYWYFYRVLAPVGWLLRRK